MIDLEHVSFTYQQGRDGAGIKDIDLSVASGEVVLLCGESGCGKTTLTRILNGLIPHYHEGSLSGSVRVGGLDVSEVPLYETAKLVGSVFQNPRSQFFNVDTTSELAFSCENQGMKEDRIIERIDHTVADLRIEKLMGRSIFKLSGGEKQKIACASVSTAQPELFVLDEPSSNLDAAGIEDLRRVIALWKNQGRSIVVAEHRLYYLRDLVDRVFYMEEGRITQKFTMEELANLSTMELAARGLRPLALEQIDRGIAAVHASRTSERLCIRELSFCYRGETGSALDVDELIIPRGAAVAVIGYNGAGKSTFARCLCGLEKRCKAVLDIGGETLKGKQQLNNCYMVMQDVNHQLFTESVFDEVVLSMKGVDGEDEVNQRVKEILASLDLSDFSEAHPMSLSGGQKQRVAIASAVASERDIIVFDEPTSGLDLRHMREVAANILHLKALGKTQFVITHDPEFITACCNYIILVEDGCIIEEYELDRPGVKRMLDFFLSAQRESSYKVWDQ